jgi:hypothetical protein
MKRNVHVGPVCDRILAQLREQTHSLNERRDVFERIARLPLAEADDLRIATYLTRIADATASSGVLTHAAGELEAARDIERLAKQISSGSTGARK